MWNVIDRYLLREVIHNWLLIAIVLWLVLLSDRLANYLGHVATGELPADVVFTLLGVKSIWLLVYIMPFSLGLGIVMGLGRMYRDSEMTVLGACGVGPWRIYKPLLVLGMILALVLGWMALNVSPRVAAYGDRMTKLAEQEADISVLGAGRFNAIRRGLMTIYAEELSADRKGMKNVFVHVQGVKNKGVDPEVVIAKHAYRMTDAESGDNYLVLVDGTRYQGWPGEANYRILKFDKHGVRIELFGKPRISSKKNFATTQELLASGTPADIAELQWRVSVPATVIVLILLAVPLSRVTPRQGRHSGLVAAILVFVIYYNILGTAKVWVEESYLPPVMGLWWVHVAFALLAILLLDSRRLLCRLRGSK